MNSSMSGLPVHHQLSEFTQTHVHWVSDAIQPSHLLSSPSPPALNLSQHQGLFKWVSSLCQVAKISASTSVLPQTTIWPSNPTPRHKLGGNQIERDTCILLFTAELFTIAKTWKQPRCPSTDEWIKKLWYIYTVEYFSAIKRNAFESVLMRWMNIDPVIQSEVSQKEKDKYWILTYVWNLENWYWRIYSQGSSGETDLENRLMDTGRREERVRCMERVTWKFTLPYVK